MIDEQDGARIFSPGFQAEKVGSPFGYARRQHGHLYCRIQRQRSALSRIRHRRSRRALRVRRSCLPAHPRQTSQHRGTDGIQNQPGAAAQSPRRGQASPRISSAHNPSHGRASHRRFGSRLRAPGESRPQRNGSPRHRRCAAGLAGIDAPLLAPYARNGRRIEVERGRRFDRRTLPPSAPQ